MPWSNQGGGGPWGGGGGPWGRGPSGGGPQPPNLEEFLRRGQQRFRSSLPKGFGGGRGFALIGLLLVAIWAASGFYRVQPNEQGVVLRFGAYHRTTGPGLHYHLPTPIESVFRPDVTRENRIEIGFRSAGGTAARAATQRDVPHESLMITGDENVVDIDFVVFWRIKDAGDFLFNLQNPEETVKMAAESAMREIIGQNRIQFALTEGRAVIEARTLELLQRLLDEYRTGIDVRQLQLLAVDPPASVIDAFNEVQRARQDRDRAKNEAEAYANDVVPRARGEAARLIEEANAYKREVVDRATGDADRFRSVYEAYAKAKDVTTQRIYLETLEEVLRGVNKVIIDEQAGGPGVVPYLPLPEVQRRMESGRPATATRPAGGSTQ